MMLVISLFGTFHVMHDDVPITNFRSDKVRALLAYLALESERPHRREVLATLFWPDQSERSARLNLRQALYRLRQALATGDADDLVLVTPHEVQFDPDAAWVDAMHFAALLDACDAHPHAELSQCGVCAQRLRQATELYEGPLLAGLSLSDSEPFEEWLVPMRERFHHRALQTLQTLTEHALAQHDYERAQQHAQRQIALEPWREVAHQQLMRALAMSGQRGMALAQFKRCAEILEEELGVEPDGVTTELADRIRAGAFSSAPHWEGEPSNARFTLPLPLSAFFGRQEELAQLDEWLASGHHRLITLVGPGGIGKTRLALEAALTHRDRFADGACFVPLGASDADPPLVSTLAAALNLPLGGQRSPRQQIIDFLAVKSLLLVLDGFEAVQSLAAELVHLISHAPSITVLVTSRVRSGMVGEWVLPVAGFAVPTAVANGIADSPAVQLFVMRAQQVRLGFAPDAEARRAILNICRLVGGIPLGIELAATWVKALTCREIEAELRQSLALLLDPARREREGLPALQPLLDQSWRLLSPIEKLVFQKLSIFPGSFDRRAAEAIAGTTLRPLLHLIDHSFLQRDDRGRYEAHELMRHYGLAHLGELPHDLADTQNRHAAYYSDLLAQRLPDLRGQHQRSALLEISEEIDNVRAAWEWSVAERRLPLLDRALDGLFHFYDIRSWFEEGEARFRAARVMLEEALHARGEDGASLGAVEQELMRLLGKVQAREGWFAFHLGEEQRAQASLHRSLELLREINARSEQLFSLNYLAAVNYYAGDYVMAETLCVEASALAAEIDDRHGLAIASNISSQIAFVQGDLQAAERYSRTSLDIEREIGNRWSMAFSLLNLGKVSYAQGKYKAAKLRFEESLAIREEMEDVRGIANCYNHLGESVEALGRPEEAQRQYDESLALFRSIGDRWGMMMTQIKRGRVALTLGQLDEAEASLRAALEHATTLHIPPMTLDALTQWAKLLLQRNEVEAAARLLNTVRHHPATPENVRREAEALRPDEIGEVEQGVHRGGGEMAVEEIVRRIVGLPVAGEPGNEFPG